MQNIYLKIIETLAIIAIYIILRGFSFKIIKNTLKDKTIQRSRGVIIRSVVNVIFILISLFLIVIIWGVNQSDLISFVASVLTIIGVALFAQWSLLSNITSGVILFFNHSIRIGDHIVILEAKDYIIEGEVIDIGLFFVTLETNEQEEIMLPNNIFIQKSLKKKIEVEQED